MTVRGCMLPERTVGSNRKAEWKRTSGVEAENRRNETMNAQGKRSGETAREYAYRMIREQVISLELKPGEAFMIWNLRQK